MKPETKFRAKVRGKLKQLPHTAFYAIQQVAIRGVPDYLLCIRGLFIGLELKDKFGKLAPLQRYELDQISAAGGLSIECDENNWEEVWSLLQKLSRGEKDDRRKIRRNQ